MKIDFSVCTVNSEHLNIPTLINPTARTPRDTQLQLHHHSQAARHTVRRSPRVADTQLSCPEAPRLTTQYRRNRPPRTPSGLVLALPRSRSDWIGSGLGFGPQLGGMACLVSNLCSLLFRVVWGTMSCESGRRLGRRGQGKIIGRLLLRFGKPPWSLTKWQVQPGTDMLDRCKA